MLENAWISSPWDLYTMSYQTIAEMLKTPGFGSKRVSDLLLAIKNSENVRLSNFINAMGIPGIGKKQADQLSDYFEGDIGKFNRGLNEEVDLREIDGFGDVLHNNIYNWYQKIDKVNYGFFTLSLNFIKDENVKGRNTLQGKTFVITGSLMQFRNREQLQTEIENAGGKVISSVSKNTDYLINNDLYSSSSKNKKAEELMIPIITENDVIDMMKGE